MAAEIPLSPNVKEFFNLLGQLISIRTKQYVSKHHRNSEAEFINNFFVVVNDIYDFDKDELRYSADAKRHFEKNIGIELARLEFEGVMLDEQKEIMYFFSTFPDFLASDYNGDYFSFTVTNDVLKPIDHRQLQAFVDADNELVETLITKVKQEITFGTIKGS